MTVFFLIRHALHSLGGERIAGRTPGVHLSPDGRVQAAQLAERLADVPLKAIYCSPLERTRETAQPIADRLGLPVQVCEELNELNYGDWSGQKLEDLRKLEKWQQFNSFRSGTRVPNGELMLETQARIIREMQCLRERHPDDYVALVSHGDVIKSAVAYCLGVHLDMFQRIEISTASVSVIAMSGYGPWVLCVNNTGDLPIVENLL
jgi:probable phosphomutase (TIGR03848 family)